MSDVNGFLVLGDSHGLRESWVRAFALAREGGWGRILQVGDFGLFRGEAGVGYLDWLQGEAVRAGVLVSWFDGNHDDHSLLDEWGFFRSVLLGPKQVPGRDRLFYLPRGYGFVFGGVRFGVLGGAGSIDRVWRQRQMAGGAPAMWWESELITVEERDIAVENFGRLDVLLAHDCVSLDIPGLPVMGEVPELEASRGRLRDVVRASGPRLVVHGHMHHVYRMGWDSGVGCHEVVGLGCDGRRGSLIGLEVLGDADDPGLLVRDFDGGLGGDFRVF